KTLEDALRIRSRILLAFEEAETTGDPGERSRLMTIVIVGGGPTGVELAGAHYSARRRPHHPFAFTRRVDRQRHPAIAKPRSPGPDFNPGPGHSQPRGRIGQRRGDSRGK